LSAKLTKKPNSKQRLVLRLKRSSRRRLKKNSKRKNRRKRLSSKPLMLRQTKMSWTSRPLSRLFRWKQNNRRPFIKNKCKLFRLKPRQKVRKMQLFSKQNWMNNRKRWSLR
jgi:hypothetical protein